MYFTKSGKNWVFRFDWRMWTCGFFKPLTGTVDFHPCRYAWFVAGGPLASIGLTVLCGLICVQYGSGAWDWIGCLFWTSLFIVIISGIPFSAGLNKSDGARLWQIIRHPERTRSWMALLALQTEEANGLRPHEWNPRLLEQILTIDASANEYVYCQLMGFYRQLDEDREAGALEHLETRWRDLRALEGHCGMGYSWKLRRPARFFESKPTKLVAGASGLASCGNRNRSTLLMQESRCARDGSAGIGDAILK